MSTTPPQVAPRPHIPTFHTASNVRAPEVQTAVFRAKSAYRSDHPRALALYCSDGRFTDAVEELLRSLGHDRLDTMTLPGGPGLLNTWSAQVTDLDTVRRGSAFLIEGHGLTDVVLLAHEGCGYYKARFSNRTPDEMRARQLHDLRVAADDLARRARGIIVHGYFARPDGKTVVFDAVDLVSREPLPIG